MKYKTDFSKMKEHLADRRHIVVSGHRGAAALYPENTIYSFQNALQMGVDSLEIDLNLTSDGEVILLHDTTLDRTTNGTGPSRLYSLSDIKQLDASCKFKGTYKGEPLRIPLLTELCDLLTSRYPAVYLNVEIKDYAHETVDKALKILSEYDLLQQCVFTCFESEVIHYMKDTYDLPIQGFPASQLKHFVPGEDGTYSKLYAVGISMNLLTTELCDFFEAQNILAWSYCPDNDEQVLQSLACGVRLVTVNNPEPALRICRKKGLRTYQEVPQ